jgi:hypothetical protein
MRQIGHQDYGSIQFKLCKILGQSEYRAFTHEGIFDLGVVVGEEERSLDPLDTLWATSDGDEDVPQNLWSTAKDGRVEEALGFVLYQTIARTT